MKANQSQSKIAIVGAGLVGSMLAMYMAKQGHHVDVYERRQDMRNAKIIGGRSINLALSNRGWKALEGIGLAEPIMEISIPMYGRQIHLQNGEQFFQPYGKDQQAIYSVSRGELNRILMNAAEPLANVDYHFNLKCTGVDLEDPRIFFQNQQNEQVTVHANVVLGTDGAYSAIRQSMQKSGRFNYSQEYVSAGYKELCIPACEKEKWQIEKNALHIWPRGQFMLIALPNLDGSFTCTLFLDFEGEISFQNLKSDEEILNFFKTYFADALDLIPDLVNDFKENPTSPLVTIRCNPWNYKDKVCLLGDASHAIVPFYGQGMNSGFEDCTVFNQICEQNGDNWAEIFKTFSNTRPKDANAIADLALYNFIEMREKTADQQFIARKKLEKKIEAKYPGKFLPLYEMVTFSQIPYAQAQKIGFKQIHILNELVKVEVNDIELTSANAKALINQLFEVKNLG